MDGMGCRDVSTTAGLETCQKESLDPQTSRFITIYYNYNDVKGHNIYIYIYIINPILQSCLIILVLYVRIYIYILVYILQYHQGQKTIGKHHRRNHSFCRHEARSQPCHWIWLPGKQRNCRPFGCPSKTCRNVPWVVFVLKIEMWKSWFWYDSVIWSIVIIYTLICIDHTVS